MMNDVYEKFLKSSEEFIFAENKPEKSDIIFVPGNGYPQMAEKAAELFKKGMADWILPSGKYSVVNGKFSGVLEKSNVYDKEYGTEWEFLRDVLIKNGVPDQKILKEDQATFTYENAILFQTGDRSCRTGNRKSDFVLQILPCKKMSDVLSALVSENRILCGACECRWNYQRKLEKERKKELMRLQENSPES